MKKQIEGYPEYSVDELGNVYSMKSGAERKLKPIAAPNGYLTVYLTDTNGLNGRYHSVHVLVATLFVDNPYNKPIVDHVNDVRHDNVYTNLMWVTYSENNRKRFLNGIELLQQPYHCTIKAKSNNSKAVKCYSLDGTLVGSYASASEAARQLGIKSISNIVKCCNGHRKSCADMLWEYC